MAEGKNLVGVDIGASSIKVVQLKESRKKLQVVRWGWAPLPPQTIIDGHVMNAGTVTETLARIFQDGKIQQRDVAIGVYGQSVIGASVPATKKKTAARMPEVSYTGTVARGQIAFAPHALFDGALARMRH